MRLLEAHLPMSNTKYRISNKEFFAGKKVLVMGLGRFGGGVDFAKFACNAGAKVTITDLASAGQLQDSVKELKEFSQVEFHLGGHSVGDFEQADIVIVNPAVAPNNEFLKVAQQHDKLVTSQISIFFELCPAPIVGITGANGKSTTVALTAHLLRSVNRESWIVNCETNHEPHATQYDQVWLSGNIGNEPLLTVVEQIKPNDLVVLELSSFQIEQLAQIRKGPQVALLTNLTPNHLDRYGTFANYCAAKESIFKLQQPNDTEPPVSIFNAEDEIGAEWFEKYKKDKGRVCIEFSSDGVSEEIREGFRLPGRANVSNLAGAITVARYFGVMDEQIKNCLPKFRALPHRLQLVAEIDGVRWYNDSKATTPEGAVAALDAFEQPKIIIAGGYDKNIPFDELDEKIAKEAKAAILIGQTAEKIAVAIRACPKNQAKIVMVTSLAEAVEQARQLAASGDVVLLSPACASYDMFDNFEHRGREFIRLVRQISD